MGAAPPESFLWAFTKKRALGIVGVVTDLWAASGAYSESREYEKQGSNDRANRAKLEAGLYAASLGFFVANIWNPVGWVGLGLFALGTGVAITAAYLTNDRAEYDKAAKAIQDLPRDRVPLSGRLSEPVFDRYVDQNFTDFVTLYKAGAKTEDVVAAYRKLTIFQKEFLAKSPEQRREFQEQMKAFAAGAEIQMQSADFRSFLSQHDGVRHFPKLVALVDEVDPEKRRRYLAELNASEIDMLKVAVDSLPTLRNDYYAIRGALANRLIESDIKIADIASLQDKPWSKGLAEQIDILRAKRTPGDHSIDIYLEQALQLGFGGRHLTEQDLKELSAALEIKTVPERRTEVVLPAAAAGTVVTQLTAVVPAREDAREPMRGRVEVADLGDVSVAGGNAAPVQKKPAAPAVEVPAYV